MADSKLAVYGAITANLAIAIMKFSVAGLTGSSAMLSEGIHSAVDTGNGVLLLVGMKLSERPPTPQHPFGHGKELYFWSLIVAVLIFGLGGGISIYEGILHIRHPEPLQDPMWSYIVLGVAAIFEGTVLVIAYKAFKREQGDLSFWQALRLSKDPTTFTVLAEDAAALAGLAAAAIGVYASHALDMPILDGIASVVIGLLLAAVAVLLIRESRGLLIGEGLRPETTAAIEEIVRGHGCVRGMSKPLSMYIGAQEVLLTLDVNFEPSAASSDVTAAIRTLEHDIRARFPKIKRIYIEAGAIATSVPPAAEQRR